MVACFTMESTNVSLIMQHSARASSASLGAMALSIIVGSIQIRRGIIKKRRIALLGYRGKISTKECDSSQFSAVFLSSAVCLFVEIFPFSAANIGRPKFPCNRPQRPNVKERLGFGRNGRGIGWKISRCFTIVSPKQKALLWYLDIQYITNGVYTPGKRVPKAESKIGN